MREANLNSATSIEQILEREIRVLMYDAIGQEPTDVDCQFISRSDLAILIENVRTPLEDFLDSSCEPDAVKRYRKGIEIAISRKVQRLVEKTMERPIDRPSVTRKTETGWMGIFVFL